VCCQTCATGLMMLCRCGRPTHRLLPLRQHAMLVGHNGWHSSGHDPPELKQGATNSIKHHS
jgi:hypothetical protein